MELASLLILICAAVFIPKSNGANYEISNEFSGRTYSDDELRNPRFSIFQIINFANEPCIGSSRNGTCFTKQECENEGGSESGSCADGFGVCCILILSDGESTSLNNSYIVQTASTALGTGSRQYTICPCSSDVCRIKFDFTLFNLAAPFTATVGATTYFSDVNLHIGDCQTDTFSITGPAFAGSPLICGTNENQHMIIDTDGQECSTVNIGLGVTATSREWDIKVTQYRCGEEDGGPPGCLQWFIADTGSVRSFNFPNIARGGVVGATVTHLSNQEYDICIRTPSGANHICYVPCTSPATGDVAAIIQPSYGISISPNAAAKSGVDTSFCFNDYLTITGGTTAMIAQAGTQVSTALFCGRALETADNLVYNVASVCTSHQPFRIGVHFDGDEFIGNVKFGSMPTNANQNADVHEVKVNPGGIIGFSLCYTTGTPAAG